MKLAAAALALSAVVAANPLPEASTLLGHMNFRRDTIDYAEFVPEPCKEICRVNNGLYQEWEAKNCNKDVTDDCNRLMCKLDCAECQLRNSGSENVVNENDIDQSKDEARKQCQQLGFPTKP